MKNLKTIKFIVILIIIILVLLLILVIKILNSKDNLKYKRLSAEEIREKIISGLNYDNYIITYKVDNSIRIKKIKGNIIVTTEPSTGVYSWSDSDKWIYISGNTIKEQYVKVPSASKFLFNKHFLTIEENLRDYGDELLHFKNEKYNKRKCIVVKAGKNRDETYWIDEEKGFVLKYESTRGTKYEFTFEVDKVTDEDIKQPINTNVY